MFVCMWLWLLYVFGIVDLCSFLVLDCVGCLLCLVDYWIVFNALLGLLVYCVCVVVLFVFVG